ncbi:MAG: class E sortase [Propionibacteriaceae bacterium]|jgi:sortase A|nr:class E sortase [Propionibacteriaceae bacterium]
MAKGRGIVRGIAGLVGEVFITVGVFLVAFVVWQLWWTDVVADAEAADVVARMESGTDDDASWVHPKEVKLGDAFAIIRIPRFGAKYARPVYEGTSRAILQRGVGHYPETVLPGEIGNYSMAGHRTTYGKPFNKIAELKDGDRIIIETVDTYYVYAVTGREIVRPTQVSVVYPVPNDATAEPTQALLTMTSCEPMFSSRYRYVIHALLEGEYPKAGGLPTQILEVSQ